MEYKHELEIIGIGAPTMYVICEPIGFDGLKFENEQEGKKFNRSINFGALDKIEFVDAVGLKATTPQIRNQFGDLTEYLDYGLEWLLYGLEVKGFEFEVYYHLSLDGVYFPKMQLDFTEKDVTDGVNYVKCKLIDASNIMDYKRQSDETFNAFSDKDFKGRTITPIQTFNYLKRAIIVDGKSSYKQNENFEKNIVYYGGDASIFQPCIQIVDFGIENTLTSFTDYDYIFDTANVQDSKDRIQERSIIKAKRQLYDVKIKITGLNFYLNTIGFFTRTKLSIGYGNSPIDDWTRIDLFDTGITPSFNLVNQSYEVTIPSLAIGQRIWLYLSNTCSNPIKNTTPVSNVFVSINENFKIEVNASSKSIDNVIKAFTWYDLLNQASKVINGIPINAEKFNVGGEHYKNAIWNRRMISQNTDTFFFKPKEVFASVEEVCADVEINRDEIFIDTFDTFYTNDEIGVFQIIPSKDYTNGFNDRFQVKSAKFAYKKYEQERTTKGTSNAIHTETENALPNYIVDGVLERKFDFIRDGYLKQSTINLETRQPTTSTENDNDIFIENMVELAPSSFGTFGARLSMKWTLNPTPYTSILKILNTDSEGDSNDVSFSWKNIGLSVGANFEITEGVNVGTYEIVEITNSVLSLRNTSDITIFEGDGYIKVKYFYSNVAWQTRTSQGVLFPLDNTMNDVYYSLKRTLLRWGSYLKTCLDYSQMSITNSFFKSNGSFESRLVGESENLIENAPILYADLNDAIVDARLPKLELVADFTDVVNYMNAYKLSRGFIRCYDMQGDVVKGYVQKSDYNPFTNEFNVTLERKKEPQIMMVTLIDGNLIINGTNYGLNNWWQIQNDFIKFYDEKSRPINKFIKYNLVNLNGIIYNDSTQLSNALQNS